MTASIFDTLRYARRLKEAGVAPKQAEAMADALAGEFVPNIVTKADLGAAISALETRLTWWLLGGATVIVGLAVALIKLG